jgi:acetyl-CoA acetyltransferase
MRAFGTTQQQIAAVAAKNHVHSAHNPLSQYRVAYSVEEVLNAPPIAYPLTLPMCAPISDGAAAAVLVRESALGRFDRRRAVKVRAAVLLTGTDRRPEEVEQHVSRRAALKATSKRVSALRTCRWPRFMTRPPWARSCRSRTSASALSATEGRPRRAARRVSAGASR